MGALANVIGMGELAGLKITDEVALLEQSQDTVEVKRWRLWLVAEQGRRAGDLSKAFEALHAVDRLDTSPLGDLMTTECATTRAKALYASGEPAIAAPHIDAALSGWMRIAGAARTAEVNILEEAAEQYETLVGVRPSLLTLMTDLVGDRIAPELLETGALALSTRAALRDAAGISELEDALLEQMRQVFDPGFGVTYARAQILLAAGNAMQELDDTTGARTRFEAAVASLQEFRDRPEARALLPTLRFNYANALTRSSQYHTAQACYDECLRQFKALGDTEAQLRTRHAIIDVRRRSEPGYDPEPDLRSLAAAYDSLRSAAGELSPGAEGDLQLVRRRLLGVLATKPNSAGLVADAIRLINIIRGDHIASRAQVDPVELLLSRLSRLPRTAVLWSEPAVDAVVLVALGSGDTPLEQRAEVALCAPEFPAAAQDLAIVTAEERSRVSDRDIPVDYPAPERLTAAGTALWRAIPAPHRALLEAADTVIISPGEEHDLIPFELARTGDSWLGCRCVLVRAPASAALLQLLAPNHQADPQPGRAVIVKAADPPDFDATTAAPDDAAEAQLAAQALGHEALLLEAPAAEAVINALSERCTLFHFIGHGAAGSGGEALYLSSEVVLTGLDVRGLPMHRMPFTYLATCSVGQTRHLTGGRQRGFGITLLSHGCPGVIASVDPVPDHACARIADAFYTAARHAPIGKALLEARRQLDAKHMHPACWSTFVLQGDPFATISAGVETPRSARARVVRWPAYLTRWAATGASRDLDLAMTGIETDPGLDRSTRAATMAFVHSTTATSPPKVADPEADAALNILAAARSVGRGSEAALKAVNTIAVSGVCLDDTYALVLGARLEFDHLFGAVSFEEYHAVIEHAVEQWIPAVLPDAPELAADAERFAEWRQAAARHRFIDLTAGDPETMRRALHGNRAAMGKAALFMAATACMPDVAAEARPWHEWLLRAVGANTEQAINEAAAAMLLAGQTGELSTEAAQAGADLLNEFFGPGMAPANRYAHLLGLLRGNDAGRMAVETFRCFDATVSSSPDVDIMTVTQGLILAQKAEHAGARAFFAFVLADKDHAEGRHADALALALPSLDRLDKLARADAGYREQLAKAAISTHKYALHGNPELAAKVMLDYREVISEYSAAHPPPTQPQRRGHRRRHFFSRH